MYCLRNLNFFNRLLFVEKQKSARVWCGVHHHSIKMTLPRRAPCNAKQAKAFANQEVAHLKRELTKQAERDEVNEGRRRKTPIKISELLKSKSGGKRLNDAASSVLFGWLENHMENP